MQAKEGKHLRKYRITLKANPESRVAVKSRIPSRNCAFFRIPHYSSLKSRIQRIPFLSLLFSPDRLRIYNWKKLTPLAYLDYHTDTVNAVDFSDDLPEYGQLLAAGGKDARISLWSLYNEKRQAVQ